MWQNAHGLERQTLRLLVDPSASAVAHVVSVLGTMLETNLTAEQADAPRLLEFVVIDGDHIAGDGNSSDDNSGEESCASDESRWLPFGDAFVELQRCVLCEPNVSIGHVKYRSGGGCGYRWFEHKMLRGYLRQQHWRGEEVDIGSDSFND